MDAKGNPLPQYFQPRPSNAIVAARRTTTAATRGYSGAANLGPDNSTLLTTVKQLQQQISAFDHVPVSEIPAGRGDRIRLPGLTRTSPRRTRTSRSTGSRRRGTCRPSEVQSLVSKYTQGRSLGFLGEPRVDVLDAQHRPGPAEVTG